MVSNKPSQNKKKRNKGRQIKKVKTVYNCLRMMNLDIEERLPINVFLSIFLILTDFFDFLLPTTCLLLGMYSLLLYIYLFPLRCHPMTLKKEILKKNKKLQRKK